MAKPIVIGLTGGIASGKSQVAKLLAARGAAVVDADAIARQVVAPGTVGFAEIVAHFGRRILTGDGVIDRKLLGSIVFADPAARAKLGAITHPAIAAASQAQIAALFADGYRVVFYEAPLLVENNLHHAMDAVVVVTVDEATQLARLMQRDQSDQESALARVRAQLPQAAKVAVATWVLDNSGTVPALTAAVESLVRDIEAKFGALRNTATADAGEHVLLTGFPAMVARRMLTELATKRPQARFTMLVRETFLADAQAFIANTAILDLAARTTIYTGDVCDVSLGLSAIEQRALAARTTHIVHCAGIYYTGSAPAQTERVNVHGTANMVEFASRCTQLRRFVHWSSAMVCGTRNGTIYEQELIPTTFHNAYEQTKFTAEQLVRQAKPGLPWVVLRPSVLIGDSQTGEIERFDGAYHLLVALATNRTGVALPVPTRNGALLHVVPIDYVCRASAALTFHPDSAGKVYHLVDPQPMTAAEVFRRVAQLARTPEPRFVVPSRLLQALTRVPGAERLARAPMAFIATLQATQFDSSNTKTALAQTDIRCPHLSSYLPTVVQYILDSKDTQIGFRIDE